MATESRADTLIQAVVAALQRTDAALDADLATVGGACFLVTGFPSSVEALVDWPAVLPKAYEWGRTYLRAVVADPTVQAIAADRFPTVDPRRLVALTVLAALVPELAACLAEPPAPRLTKRVTIH